MARVTRGQQPEQRPLDEPRRAGEPDGVGELLGQHGGVQRPRPALGVGPAVLGGQEQLADQLLQARSGPHLDHQPDLLGGGVPEVMGDAGPDLDPGPGVGLELAAAVAHGQPAPDDRERLGGAGVDVLAATAPPGRRYRSTTSRWPLASRAATRTTPPSPVTGFSCSAATLIGGASSARPLSVRRPPVNGDRLTDRVECTFLVVAWPRRTAAGVKVERPQQGEDERPWRRRGAAHAWPAGKVMDGQRRTLTPLPWWW